MHVVSIVGVGAGFATCHSDVAVSSRARQVRGEVKRHSFSSSGCPLGVSTAEEGLAATILKGSVSS